MLIKKGFKFTVPNSDTFTVLGRLESGMLEIEESSRLGGVYSGCL